MSERGEAQRSDDEWLLLARDTFSASTNYYDANLRKPWERASANVRGEHPSGSKYHTEEYKRRSRIFRPKTRAAMLKAEADVDAAFFSTEDVVSIQAEDPANRVQVVSAAINKELLQYFLTRKIDWYRFVMGAYQDGFSYGPIIGKAFWRYEEDENGKARRDQPDLRLIPPENFRIDPASDWMSPVESSPYIIVTEPMHVVDVVARMNTEDRKTGQPQWKPLAKEEIMAMVDGQTDSTRQAREGQGQEDPVANASRDRTYFGVVWVHENIFRLGGQDWIFWTLGTEHRLTDPVPLKQVYPDGRPYVIGTSLIEAHKAIGTGKANLLAPLQALSNDVTNQRLDNVSLVLNGRHLVSRNGDTDLRSLLRSSPGGIVLTNNARDDVVPIQVPDVTQAAYREQDLINTDFDDLSGGFSSSSVASNRQLSETVGGMEMIQSTGNAMVEHDIKVFAVTFIEPILRKLLRLIQRYVSDPAVLTIAGQNAQVWQRFGVDEITDKLLEADVTLTVNVGFGATNPQKKVEKLVFAVTQIVQLAQFQGMANVRALADEIMGAVGYKDSTRFFNFPEEGEQNGPEAQQQQAAQQQAQAEEQQRAQLEAQKLSMEREKAIMSAQLQREKMLTDTKTKLSIAVMDKQKHDAEIRARYLTGAGV